MTATYTSWDQAQTMIDRRNMWATHKVEQDGRSYLIVPREDAETDMREAAERGDAHRAERANAEEMFDRLAVEATIQIAADLGRDIAPDFTL